MNAALAFVRPDWSPLIEINTLEVQIADAKAGLDELRWKQAEHVAALLANGWSLRKLAAQWINPKTNEPHHYSHVNWVAKVFSQLNSADPRPSFTDAYNAISNRGRFCWGNGDDEWNTPKHFIDASREVMGDIDLDPATNPAANAVVGAKRIFTIKEDGLVQPWSGRVWMNPPYSHEKIALFVNKLVTHVLTGDVTAAIVLVNNTSATRWFATLHRHSDSVCFPTGRLKFWKSDRIVRDTSVYASAIFYFGPAPKKFREVFFERFVWQGEEEPR